MKVQSLVIVLVCATSLPAQTRPAEPSARLGQDAQPAETIDSLIKMLEKDDNAKAHAIAALANIGPDALPRLWTVINGAKMTAVRYAALRSFGDDAGPALPRLLQLFHENDSAMQATTADTLLAIGPKARNAVAPYFIAQLAQPMDRDSRIATIRSLARIGPDSAAAVPALVELLIENDNGIRMEAAHALGAIGPAAAAAIPALTRMVDNRRPDIREAATLALVKISVGGKGLGPALLAAVYNGDRSCAARLAGPVRRAGADRAVLRRLDNLASEDPDATVRATARHAVEFLSADPSPTHKTQPKAG